MVSPNGKDTRDSRSRGKGKQPAVTRGPKMTQRGNYINDIFASSSSSSPSTSEDDDDDDDDVQENKDMNEDEEEDDPVIKTLDVFYTPRYLSSLTLLQYLDRPPRPNTVHPLLPPSLRPNLSTSSQSASTIKAKYKPLSQHLELEVPIERFHQTRFNDEKAIELAKGVVDETTTGAAGSGASRIKKGRGSRNHDPMEEFDMEDENEKKRLDRITYSSIAVPDVTNYLAGVIKNDELHLSPVTQTFQLRPSLKYLDQLITLERRAQRERKLELDQDGDSDADISDAELKKAEASRIAQAAAAVAVNVSVKQSQDAASGGGYMGSFGRGGGGMLGNGRAGAGLFDPLRRMEGESWVELTHRHAETPQVSQAFTGMYAPSYLGAELASVTKPSEYLQS